jgi:hypothetical protein
VSEEERENISLQSFLVLDEDFSVIGTPADDVMKFVLLG